MTNRSRTYAALVLLIALAVTGLASARVGARPQQTISPESPTSAETARLFLPLIGRQLYLRSLYELDVPRGTVAISDTLAYVPSADTLTTYRLWQGSAPEALHTLPIPCAPAGSQRVGGRLYLNCPEEGQVRVQIVDLGNPVAPRLRGGYTTQYGTFQVRFDERQGYSIGTVRFSLCCYGAIFEIYDVSDPDAPRQVASNGFQLGGYYDSATEGHTFYLTGYDYPPPFPQGAAGLTIVDTSTPGKVVLQSANSPSGGANRVRAAGKVVYLFSSGAAELQLVDAHDPAAPSPRGKLAVPGEIVDLQAADGYAYIALSDGALLIADVLDRAAPQIVGRVQLPAKAWSVAVDGRLVIVATEANKAYVFERTW